MPKSTRALKILSSPDWALNGGWMPLLRTWANLVQRYDANPVGRRRDVAYWYGERALVGLLAAAAWQQSGGWSLVEFLGRRKARSARGDLWLGTGKAEFTVEAKVHWGKRKPQGCAMGIEVQLEAAGTQARTHSREYQVGKPVAACFLVPERSNPVDEAYFDEVAEYLKLDSRLIAVIVSPAKYHSKHYAGVMLVADICKWHRTTRR